MNPFLAHGIEHLSASTCNLFVGCPAMFVLEKVLKLRQPVGAAAHRGSAVEAGIMHALLTSSGDDEAVEVAATKFAKLTGLCTDPRLDKERDGIGEMVRVGLAELRPYGAPSSVQGRIEHRVEGLQVPIIGFYDAEWDRHGILLDLKTTHRLPSEIGTNHARQVALYTAARGGNLDTRITYTTTKKVATYRLENPRAHLAAIERICLTIQRFLSVSRDPAELVAITAPDVDSFYMSDPAARRAVFDVWGF